MYVHTHGRCKIVCGEDKRLLMVPMAVEVAALEALVKEELGLGIAFSLRVALADGRVEHVSSREVLAQALEEAGWTSRPCSASVFAAPPPATPAAWLARARAARTLQVLVYTMVDKEREEAEAALALAQKEKEEREAAEREHARELAEAEAAEVYTCIYIYTYIYIYVCICAVMS